MLPNVAAPIDPPTDRPDDNVASRSDVVADVAVSDPSSDVDPATDSPELHVASLKVDVPDGTPRVLDSDRAPTVPVNVELPPTDRPDDSVASRSAAVPLTVSPEVDSDEDAVASRSCVVPVTVALDRDTPPDDVASLSVAVPVTVNRAVDNADDTVASRRLVRYDDTVTGPFRSSASVESILPPAVPLVLVSVRIPGLVVSPRRVMADVLSNVILLGLIVVHTTVPANKLPTVMSVAELFRPSVMVVKFELI